jgi:chemotaxis protein MotB
MLGTGRGGRETGADRPAEAMLWLEWEESPADEGWLVSYADLLSVILAMVVLLLGRMVVASAPTVPSAEAASALVQDRREIRTPQRPVDATPEIGPDPPDSVIDAATDGTSSTPPSRRSADTRALAQRIEQRFGGTIGTRTEDTAVLLTIADVALFDSASAELQPSARRLLAELAATLRSAGDIEVSVEGHTDDRPLQGGAFRSNWDLAAARANAVTRLLLERGFARERLRSISYADTRPVADNASAAGRAANRRVELRIEVASAEQPVYSYPP